MEKELVFWACAAVSVLSALVVVTRRNPIYSAFFLIVSLLGIAVSLIPLDATFLAAMHVLVYTGAIMVLFLFVIMLLNLRQEELGHKYPLPFRLFAGALALGLFAILAYVFATDVPAETPKVTGEFGGIKSVGTTLFESYLLPFELVSLLLLVAVFGAVILARRKEDA